MSVRRLFALGLLAGLPLTGQEAEELPAEQDLRTIERLSLACESELARRDLTLFANGTVRVREERGEERQLRLAELGPDELDAYLRRLAAEDLSETDARTSAPSGPWVERCELRLALPEKPERVFRLDRFASVSLALSRVRAIIEELEQRAKADLRGLPGGYQPQHGDVLERRDGVRFRVVGFTTDKKGVELVGVDQPFLIYVAVDNLSGEFIGLVVEGER